MKLKEMIAESIRENYAQKDEILSSVLNAGAERRKPAQRRIRKAVAFALAAALLLSFSIIVIASGLLRTVGLQLSVSKENIEPGETVTLTVSAVNPQSFRKGIVGLTMDVYYNSAVMEYDAAAGISSTLDANKFSVEAHKYAEGKIAVLIYADELDAADAKLFAVQSAGPLFSLPFKVKAGVTSGTCQFSVPEYKLADYNDDDTGFTYATVDSAPASVSVTVATMTDYTVSIPSGTATLTGPDSTLLGQISLGSGSVLPAAGLSVTVVGDNGSELLKTGDPAKKIPYLLAKDEAQTPLAPVTFTNAGANAPQNVYVHITLANWNAALAGTYTGKVTFTISENS